MIVATDVGMTNAGQTLLHPVSFRADPGTTFCMHGPAGCGKSLLAALLSGGMACASGRISVDGRDITNMRGALLQIYRRHLGIVTQRPLLSRHGSILDNILLAGALRKQSSGPSVQTLLNVLDLADKAHTPAWQMPTDVQILVTIARALIGSPAILIFDEPFPLLRPDTRHKVRSLLEEAVHAGATAFVFTRDPTHLQGLSAETISLLPEVQPVMSADPNMHTARHVAVEEESAESMTMHMHA